jgi:hypothetical protein
VLLPRLVPPPDLVLGEREAFVICIRVAASYFGEGLPGRLEPVAHGVELLRRVEGDVGVARVEEALDVLAVEAAALGLRYGPNPPSRPGPSS